MHTLLLLEHCMLNCGYRFHVVVGVYIPLTVKLVVTESFRSNRPGTFHHPRAPRPNSTVFYTTQIIPAFLCPVISVLLNSS
ncbi:hypothetical protein FGIG_12606 [Fasciola gigantica]|uniref:VHS domain-containing protein n=1 Tax=Fasciola gigantica TaxID=46835 RepID=A0A504Z353_FASGI|nr:hypothetical protein FGIG_12606 [Fasciola gigantica]